MARQLQIIKLSDKVWKHIDSITGAYILTKFYAKEDDSKFLIVEVYGSRRYEYAIEDISVYNIGGSAETFTNFDDLFLRLEVLKYTGFYVDGEFVFNPSAYDLSEFQNTETDRFAKLSDITGGGIPEAPIDGDLYGRKDGDWEIIPTSGGSSTNKQIFHWWGGSWSTTSLNLYYYISYNGGAIETQPGSVSTTATSTMQGRNKGLFIAPFDCKIRRVIFKEGASGSYTGKFALVSGLPNYGTTWTFGYSSVVVHLDEVITSGGFWQNKFEFLVTDDITIPKGYLVSPSLFFSAQAQAGKNGVEISIEIEEVI